MSAPVLSVREISVTLPSRAGDTKIVDRVSLDLEAGELVGIAGESGCGKTMLALALMGLLENSGARVEARALALSGQNHDRAANGFARYRGQRIAMVFQEPGNALDPVFSIGWQLRVILQRRFDLSRRAARDKAIAALARTGFSDPEGVYRAYPHHLSGGMQQLAMIAMAAAIEPDVLIADEPTTALDVTTQRLAMHQLLKLRDRAGTAILLISHDIGLIAEYCSRILIMYCGRIVEGGPYAEFHARPRHPYSAGLLDALPRLDSDAPVQAMRGAVAALNELPKGCHFAPRCDRATAQCHDQSPELLLDQGRMFACHHPL